MPGGDRTGPERMGPLTGRGMGSCAGSDEPEFSSQGFGRGRGFGGGRGAGGGRGFGGGRGAGGGRGWRNWFRTTDRAPLQGQVDALHGRLDEIVKRLDELIGSGSGKS